MGILRKYLNNLGLSAEGKKPVLAERLQNAISKWVKNTQTANVVMCTWYSHCSKLKMKGKKLSQFKLYFPGLLGASPVLEQEKKL